MNAQRDELGEIRWSIKKVPDGYWSGRWGVYKDGEGPVAVYKTWTEAHVALADYLHTVDE